MAKNTFLTRRDHGSPSTICLWCTTLILSSSTSSYVSITNRPRCLSNEILERHNSFRMCNFVEWSLLRVVIGDDHRAMWVDTSRTEEAWIIVYELINSNLSMYEFCTVLSWTILHHVGVGERYVDEGVERETNEEKWTHIDKMNVYIGVYRVMEYRVLLWITGMPQRSAKIRRPTTNYRKMGQSSIFADHLQNHLIMKSKGAHTNGFLCHRLYFC